MKVPHGQNWYPCYGDCVACAGTGVLEFDDIVRALQNAPVRFVSIFGEEVDRQPTESEREMIWQRTVAMLSDWAE